MLCKLIVEKGNVCVFYVKFILIFVLGDYQDCIIVVWSIRNYEILIIFKIIFVIYDLKWDLFFVNEFVFVGQDGFVFFWLLDEIKNNVCLNVYEVEVLEELL